MASIALKALTSTTGNRTDKWNTPPDFVADVVKFLERLTLTHVQIVRVILTYPLTTIIMKKLMD